MGLLFMSSGPRLWRNCAREQIAARFKIHQNGDWEGATSFDPENREQSLPPIQVIEARKKRRLSEICTGG